MFLTFESPKVHSDFDTQNETTCSQSSIVFKNEQKWGVCVCVCDAREDEENKKLDVIVGTFVYMNEEETPY